MQKNTNYGSVVESNYDYWSIYYKNQLILASKRKNYVCECFNKIRNALDGKPKE